MGEIDTKTPILRGEIDTLIHRNRWRMIDKSPRLFNMEFEF